MNLLILDDEKDITIILKEIVLSAFPSFIVHTANSVQEAIDLFAMNDFEIVLTDIKMPTVRGTELIKIIKSTREKTQVIVISGQSDHEDLVQCLKYQADDFVAKPFLAKDIFLAITRALAKINGLETEDSQLLNLVDLENNLLEISGSLVKKIAAVKQQLEPNQSSATVVLNEVIQELLKLNGGRYRT